MQPLINASTEEPSFSPFPSPASNLKEEKKHPAPLTLEEQKNHFSKFSAVIEEAEEDIKGIEDDWCVHGTALVEANKAKKIANWQSY